MSYFREIVKGFGWIGGFRVLSRGVAFARTAVVARILSPAQFGVYGIVLIVLAFLELLTETGINIFLIQEKEDINGYINTAWVISIVRGILIAALVFVSAPLLASFFKASELKNLLYLASIVPLVRGFINPSIVKFQKELQFRKEFWLRSVIFTFDSGVAVIFAYFLKNPSGLIFGLIAGAGLEVILSYLFVKPLPRFNFEKIKALRIVSRGKWVSAAGVFDYLAKNGDNLVVGRLLGTTPLGFYQMAYAVATLPVVFSDDAGKVTFPVYSKISSDKILLKRIYVNILLLFTLVLIPIPIVLFVFPSTVISIVLGESWLPIVDTLKILAVFSVVRFISGTSSALFYALKKQELVTTITFVRLLTLALFVIPYTILFGIEGTAMAALISSVVPLPIIIYNLAKVLK